MCSSKSFVLFESRQLRLLVSVALKMFNARIPDTLYDGVTLKKQSIELN